MSKRHDAASNFRTQLTGTQDTGQTDPSEPSDLLQCLNRRDGESKNGANENVDDVADSLLLGDNRVQTRGESEHTRSRDGGKEDLVYDETTGSDVLQERTPDKPYPIESAKNLPAHRPEHELSDANQEAENIRQRSTCWTTEHNLLGEGVHLRMTTLELTDDISRPYGSKIESVRNSSRKGSEDRHTGRHCGD